MTMRAILVSGFVLALTGCMNVVNAPQVPRAVPAVTQSMPEEMASLDPADSILFWSDERRSGPSAGARRAGL